MPFTLAHPAVVLPLRRYCPRLLNFPALVIGSITPDLGYFFGRLNVNDYAHGLIGSVMFCFPLGLLLTALFYRLRTRVVGMLPGRQRERLLPLCRRPVGSWLGIIVSLMIGVWTHLLLDSFTHKDGWGVEHLPVLQIAVGSVADHTVRIHHLLWYAFSFAGVFWLYYVYEQWRRAAAHGAPAASGLMRFCQAVIIAALAVFIGAFHHLVPGSRGFYLAVIMTLILVAGIALRPERLARS
jgi:hypothetical protein